jgi:hypothetical protein
MAYRTLLELSGYLEFFVCIAGLVAMVRRSQVRNFPYLSGFFALHILLFAALTPLMYAANWIGRPLAYEIYFGVYWSCAALESAILLGIVYRLFQDTRALSRTTPQNVMRILLACGGIAFAAAVAVGFRYHRSLTVFFAKAVGVLGQIQSLLTLVLALWILLAIRPLGWSWRNRVFGISAGLGVLSLSYLASAAEFSTSDSRMYSVTAVVTTLGSLMAVSIWAACFALPEPSHA